ncbi:MAG TPA: holin family protein [Rickettsia endosymbiont of Bembidion lapponicum]|nr:holin family protein [Rickettsia endosymbiont of Bembidion lapponicum]
MITLLAAITGFISSIIPEILKIYKDINDKRHEIDILDRQITNNKLNQSKTFTELTISQEMAEQYALYSTYKSGVSWVDALNGSVRPVLAYSFFAMYGIVKYVQYKSLKSSALLVQYLDILWTIDDQTIFAGIISFYFGQRTFNKLYKYKT